MACLISNFTCFVLSDFTTDFMLYSGRPVYQLYIDISPFNSLLAIKTYFCVHRICFFHRNLHEYIHLPFMLEMVLKDTLNFMKLFTIAASDSGNIWCPGVNYFRLDGSTPALERERLINAFNADFSVKLFLVSTRAGVRKKCCGQFPFPIRWFVINSGMPI